MINSVTTLNPDNWINQYAQILYSFALQKTGKAEIAEDLVQETFLAGLNSQASFKGLSSEKTWLFTILKFKIADYYRKASTKFEVSNTLLSSKENDSFIDYYFSEDGNWKTESAPKNWNKETLTAVETKELGLALNHCIEKLPSNQKQLILLKLVEEEKTETICKDLNITPTNYWVIFHRAKLQLRVCIEKTWLNL
jgi:RNA polymerase sigma-70 factor (TIGR02943 family)